MSRTEQKTPARTKTVQNYRYMGLGFPVKIKSVKLIEYGDDWIIDFDPQRLAHAAALLLPIKPKPLTGNEMRFLRRHHQMTQDALASDLHMVRQSIINWEKSRENPSGMTELAETALRAYFLRRMDVSGNLFQAAFDRIMGQVFRGKIKTASVTINLKMQPMRQFRDYLDAA